MVLLITMLLTHAGEHPAIRPLSGSRLVADEERDGEMVVIYREAGSRTRKTVRGRLYSLEYETESDISAEDIIEHFNSQAEAFDGGDVHRTAGNRITFSFRREDGGETWCQVWATAGNYTLEIVDEAPAEVLIDSGGDPALPQESIAETREEVASIVFAPGSSTLPPGAGAVLDDVAKRLTREPGTALELHAGGGTIAERRANAVLEALKLYGLEEVRIVVEATEDDSDRLEFILVR
ncbi:MAG TPA: hypothetical protein VEK15_12475 [Vicinamibacteria bacterium]|nr:hypothetical protein [Vicinamibacteria bacterium]